MKEELKREIRDEIRREIRRGVQKVEKEIGVGNEVVMQMRSLRKK